MAHTSIFISRHHRLGMLPNKQRIRVINIEPLSVRASGSDLGSTDLINYFTFLLKKINTWGQNVQVLRTYLMNMCTIQYRLLA